jgi:recombination protein RecA
LTLAPTPSTLLNLACSDNAEGGIGVGKIINIIGDSSAGKTVLCLSILAEICQLPEFEKYDIINDDVENALEIDLKKMFGKKLAKRIKPPCVDKFGKPLPSDTVEDFLSNILDAADSKRPFIYLLDSLDALDAKDDQKKADEIREAKKKGTKAKGTYGGAKPKTLSWILRTVKAKLKNTNSILIIISQTRDNLNARSFETKYRAGGRALKFYCTHEIWLAVIKKLTKTIDGNKINIGSNVRAIVKKNKLTGKVREAEFAIYYDYGVDDTSSCIDYLLKWKVWKKKKSKIVASQFDKTLAQSKLIEYIESNPKYKHRLRKIVAKKYLEIEDKLKLGRRPKYN